MTRERRTGGRSIEPAIRRRDLTRAIAGGVLLPPLAACAEIAGTHRNVANTRMNGRPTTMTVVVDMSSPGPMIDAGYAGFSYEKSAVGTGFFTASNLPLVRLFRHLGSGLLRLGGNSVDRTGWRTASVAQTGAVTPGDVDALSTFLAATGWKALYGVNLATSTPATAAAEAAYATRSLGRHLYAFEIGNEPDAYSFNHLRSPSYSYRDFIRQWREFAHAVRREVPPARLTGPASAWHETSWTVPFARDEGRLIILLTQHYYRANGLSPKSTLALLLAGDPALAGLLDPLWRASRAAGIRDGYRLTEANSFYDGGAPNVSDTFGAALWAIEFLFITCRHGSSGVNFHGGGKAPGYTPIADNGRTVVAVRPEYYAMLLFSLMGPGRLLNVALSSPPLAVSAHAVAGAAGTQIVLVNKERHAGVDVTIVAGEGVTTARVMILTAPALDSVTGVTLNGAPIVPEGFWSPRPSAAAAVQRNGSIALRLGAASAVLVTAA